MFLSNLSGRTKSQIITGEPLNAVVSRAIFVHQFGRADQKQDNLYFIPVKK